MRHAGFSENVEAGFLWLASALHSPSDVSAFCKLISMLDQGTRDGFTPMMTSVHIEVLDSA